MAEHEETDEFCDENEYQPWYDHETEKYVESKVDILKDVAFFHVPSMKRHFICPKDDKQYIKIEYFGYIDPDEIEYNCWNELRFQKVMEVIDMKNTSRVFFTTDKEGFSIAGGNLILPYIRRSYKWNEKPLKFVVIDGNHRIAAAKKKKLNGLICKVFEIISIENKFDMDDFNKYINDEIYSDEKR